MLLLTTVMMQCFIRLNIVYCVENCMKMIMATPDFFEIFESEETLENRTDSFIIISS